MPRLFVLGVTATNQDFPPISKVLMSSLGKWHALKKYDLSALEKYWIRYYTTAVEFHEIFVTKVMNALEFFVTTKFREVRISEN